MTGLETAPGTASPGRGIRRRTLFVLIIACWAGALGWLAVRHYIGGGIAGTEERPRWPVPPGSAYLAIRLADRQIGLTTYTIDTLQEGLRVDELLTIDLPRLVAATPRRTSARIQALYTRSLQLRNWQADLLTERGRESSTGTVEGDTLLTVVTQPRGEPAETLRVKLRRSVVLPSGVQLVAASRGLPEPGSRLNVEVFDPFDLELRVERLTIAAESILVVSDSAEYSETLKRWATAHNDTLRAWRFDGLEHGLPVSRWIDAGGMLVRAQYPLGATIERSAFELINTNYRALPPPPWDTSATAPSYQLDSSPPPVRPSLRALARLGRTGRIPADVPALEGGWQQRSADTLTVGPVANQLPPDSAHEAGEPLWSPAAPDSSVVRVAEQVVGSETRPDVRARTLAAWVGRTIKLRSSPGTATPARTLSRKQGNAQERVLLLTAMARGAGFTARPVWGLVLIRGHWQLRSWVEVWTNTWLPLDPAVPRGASDAGRIRLATGGMSRFMILVLWAGLVRLEPLEETA